MSNPERHARKKAMGAVIGEIHKAMAARLRASKAPPPQQAQGAKKEEKDEEDISDEDTRRLIEMYESKQGETPEAES